MSTDVLLNECGDIKIENGDAVLIRGVDQIKQRWLIHMRTFFGEWFLDLNRGVPYIQKVFSKKVTRPAIRRILKEESLKVEGILRVTSLAMGDIDPITRTLNDVEITCDIEEGHAEDNLFSFTGSLSLADCAIESAADYPLSVGDLRMWFDAQDMDNLEYSISGASLVLQNKAGAGYAEGQGSGGTIPVLVPVSPIGLKRSIYFDSANIQTLRVRDTQAIRHGENTLSIFIVMLSANSVGAQYGLLGLHGTELPTEEFSYYNTEYDYNLSTDKGSIICRSGYVSGQTVTSSSFYPNEPMLISAIVKDTSKVLMYKNGNYIHTGSTELRKLNGEAYIGARVDPSDAESPELHFKGYIGEVLVYAGEIADNDLINLQTFLMNKWSL